MPKPKEMEKLAREVAQRRDRATHDPAPVDPMPDQMWQSVLADPRAETKLPQPIQQCALSDIKQHVLRVECQRCLRIVEIQKADAIRFYGERAIWKDVGQRLLDQTCTNRTGSREEDGCWPKLGRIQLGLAKSLGTVVPAWQDIRSVGGAFETVEGAGYELQKRA